MSLSLNCSYGDPPDAAGPEDQTEARPAVCHSLPRFMSAGWMPVLPPATLSTLLAYSNKPGSTCVHFIHLFQTAGIFLSETWQVERGQKSAVLDFHLGKAEREVIYS